jgi:hypothetical protein
MATVWVRPERLRDQDDPVPDYIDHVADDLAQWLGALTVE